MILSRCLRIQVNRCTDTSEHAAMAKLLPPGMSRISCGTSPADGNLPDARRDEITPLKNVRRTDSQTQLAKVTAEDNSLAI